MFFDNAKLAAQLQSLPARHRIAFSAACAERLYSCYWAFSTMEEWGNPELLRSAINQVWSFLLEPVEPCDFSDILERFDSIVPDDEDFGSLFSGPAQHAVQAVDYALRCCHNSDASLAAGAAHCVVEAMSEYLHTMSYPMVDLVPSTRWVPDRSGTALEMNAYQVRVSNWVACSPLIQLELAKQEQDVEYLSDKSVIDPASVQWLRESSAAMGVKPEGRGIGLDDLG